MVQKQVLKGVACIILVIALLNSWWRHLLRVLNQISLSLLLAGLQAGQKADQICSERTSCVLGWSEQQRLNLYLSEDEKNESADGSTSVQHLPLHQDKHWPHGAHQLRHGQKGCCLRWLQPY